MYLFILLLLVNCMGEAGRKSKKRKSKDPVKSELKDEPISPMSEDQRKFHESIDRIILKKQRREIELAAELNNCSNNNNTYVKNN